MNKGFSREKRLLQSQQFKAVFDSPDHRLSGRCVLLLSRLNQLEHPRLGLVIGKKNVKLAVDRNRIKRQFRESFRQQQAGLPGVDIVLVARRHLGDLSNDELNKVINTLIKRLIRQTDDKQPSAAQAGSPSDA